MTEPDTAGVADVVDEHARVLRARLAEHLAEVGETGDAGWLAAVERVPRHAFTPGFYLPADEPTAQGLARWEPITAELDRNRWLAAVYTDQTLITQFDETEPDWNDPAPREGGVPTSSSTLPSLVVRMWADADLREGHTVLEIGAGTGYSTALACEHLGSDAVTTVEVDPQRLDQAATALYGCGYTPDLAVADGLYGYWPYAPFDRIVAACSVCTIPPAWPAQTRPGGKILTTLGGWLHGYARALLTVAGDGTAEGPLLPGTVSFMPARTHAAPAVGNPAHWATGLPEASRPARHSPERITAANEEAFHLRFLAQCAAGNTQMTTMDDTVHLIDVVSGSAATLTPRGLDWQVRQAGPIRLWDRIEAVLDAYDHADRPAPDTFRLRLDEHGQHLHHPKLPDLTLPTP